MSGILRVLLLLVLWSTILLSDLVRCPDCQKEVSTRADKCPHCGCPGAAIRAQNGGAPSAPTVQTLTGNEASRLGELTDTIVLIRLQTPQGEGRGTGFFLKTDGQLYVVTNQHVIAGASRVSMETLNGTRLKPSGFEVVRDQDLARFPFRAEARSTVKALGLYGQAISENQKVVAVGDSGGKGVSVRLPGKVLGVGANKIEVDAGFVQGNSGGPIIDVQSGRVMGVVVFITREARNWTNAQTRFGEDVRRFAERMGPTTKWVKVDYEKFQKQARLASDWLQFTYDCAAAIDIFNRGPGLYPPERRNYHSKKVYSRSAKYYGAARKQGKKSFVASYYDVLRDIRRDLSAIGKASREEPWLSEFLRDEAESVTGQQIPAFEGMVKGMMDAIKDQAAVEKRLDRIRNCPNSQCQDGMIIYRGSKGEIRRRCPVCGQD